MLLLMSLLCRNARNWVQIDEATTSLLSIYIIFCFVVVVVMSILEYDAPFATAYLWGAIDWPGLIVSNRVEIVRNLLRIVYEA